STSARAACDHRVEEHDMDHQWRRIVRGDANIPLLPKPGRARVILLADGVRVAEAWRGRTVMHPGQTRLAGTDPYAVIAAIIDIPWRALPAFRRLGHRTIL